jgi:hypothetical protein
MDVSERGRLGVVTRPAPIIPGSCHRSLLGKARMALHINTPLHKNPLQESLTGARGKIGSQSRPQQGHR